MRIILKIIAAPFMLALTITVAVLSFLLSLSAGVLSVLAFVLGGAGVIAGSVLAVRETRWKRMLAASSIAQVGLVYVAAGLGGRAALAAGLFQLVCHAVAKPLLFLSGAALAGWLLDRLDDLNYALRSFITG